MWIQELVSQLRLAVSVKRFLSHARQSGCICGRAQAATVKVCSLPIGGDGMSCCVRHGPGGSILLHRPVAIQRVRSRILLCFWGPGMNCGREALPRLQNLAGLRIRRLREEQGWTQAHLAELCELHRTFIGSVERGERNVSILNLRTIARALRVGVAELVGKSAGQKKRED